MFDFRVPQYVFRTPETIKQIGVRDFDYFEDHRAFTDSDTGRVSYKPIVTSKSKRFNIKCVCLSSETKF